jgi:hypothetical protein
VEILKRQLPIQLFKYSTYSIELTVVLTLMSSVLHTKHVSYCIPHIHPSSTPLMIAAVRGHEPTVKALLSHGASTEAADKDGLTALHWSTAMGHLGVVEALVAAGAKVGGKCVAGGVSVEDLAVAASPQVC